MARRKASVRSVLSTVRVSAILPICTLAKANANTAMFASYLQGLGITGIPSYLRKLAVPVVLCVLAGACAGAIHSGVNGLFVGALLSLAAPAALIWLVITLIHFACYLIAFCAAWLLIFIAARWLFSSGF